MSFLAGNIRGMMMMMSIIITIAGSCRGPGKEEGADVVQERDVVDAAFDGVPARVDVAQNRATWGDTRGGRVGKGEGRGRGTAGGGQGLRRRRGQGRGRA